jgi:hypothetical protein
VLAFYPQKHRENDGKKHDRNEDDKKHHENDGKKDHEDKDDKKHHDKRDVKGKEYEPEKKVSKTSREGAAADRPGLT